ncbi:uncharacterized peptidase C1-like protein F26E4.3 isoform X2 [Macrobrachium nipponense]|uniref:uncharacterized peptidase C1-like protein F26E4.3 isoform X2 n=1 Tax=Macrobrachium nipponense TaxID=159736 RepID=UPI0030C7EAAD
MAPSKYWSCFVGVFLTLSTGLLQVESQGFHGIGGNFCRIRQPSGCCDGRMDSCQVPIQDTFCYCDEFCMVCLGWKWNHTLPDVGSNDDFPEANRPKATCARDFNVVPHGESLQINCNECYCDDGLLECQEDLCMTEEFIVSAINKSPGKYGWTATMHSKFEGRKAQDGLRLRTGTFGPQDKSHEMHPIRLHPDLSKIPERFDARKKVEWAGRVAEVSDQRWCGSSWVFSTLGVAQDRLSILAKDQERMELSAQSILSCAELGQRGCEGGHIERAWNYLRAQGIVREECYKYESGHSGNVPKCLIKGNDLSKLTCQAKDRYRFEPAYRIAGKEEDIQWEIMHNGPVQALMTVHADLFMYNSGIYSYSGLTADLLKGGDSATHSVRIIGWGSSRIMGSNAPTKYWVVANSWGSQWGEGGYFRIKRGTNECGIESFVLASRAKLANVMDGIKGDY